MKLLVPAATLILILSTPCFARQGISCSDFHQNQDGSWSSNRPVSIAGPNGQVQIGQGASFRPGVAFNGIDLATYLNQQCAN